MSYSDKQMGRERLAAFGLVAVVQGGIVAALVSGLAVSVINRPLDPPLTIYSVRQTPPPPLDPVPRAERPHARTLAQPVSLAPTPLVPILTDPLVPVIEHPPIVDVMPVGPLEIPRPVPPVVNMSKGASARGDVAGWFPQDSYPPAALRAQVEGRVGVALTVLPTGRGSDCEVVGTSGNADLDQATCRLALRNGRFQPARDQEGKAVTARIVLPSVRWRIEK